jgi:hypothetical protein
MKQSAVGQLRDVEVRGVDATYRACEPVASRDLPCCLRAHNQPDHDESETLLHSRGFGQGTTRSGAIQGDGTMLDASEPMAL